MFSLLRLPGSGLLVRLATLRFNVLRNFGRLIDIPSDKDSSPGLIVPLIRVDVKWDHLVGLIRVSLMTNEVGFFPLPIDRSHVFFGGMSNRIFCPFLKSWAFLSLLLPVLLSLEESFTYFRYK